MTRIRMRRVDNDLTVLIFLIIKNAMINLFGNRKSEQSLQTLEQLQKINLDEQLYQVLTLQKMVRFQLCEIEEEELAERFLEYEKQMKGLKNLLKYERMVQKHSTALEQYQQLLQKYEILENELNPLKQKYLKITKKLEPPSQKILSSYHQLTKKKQQLQKVIKELAQNYNSVIDDLTIQNNQIRNQIKKIQNQPQQRLRKQNSALLKRIKSNPDIIKLSPTQTNFRQFKETNVFEEKTKSVSSKKRSMINFYTNRITRNINRVAQDIQSSSNERNSNYYQINSRKNHTPISPELQSKYFTLQHRVSPAKEYYHLNFNQNKVFSHKRSHVSPKTERSQNIAYPYLKYQRN